MGELPELIVPDAVAWRAWLEAHHPQAEGVRLVLARKGHAEVTMLSYDDALDEALCFGWIDGQVSRRDDHSYRQRFTPRRARSPWSKRNVALAEALREAGRMHPAGQAEIERAQADGRWAAAYAGAASIEVPADLRAALDATPEAAAMFSRLTSQNRYAILYRLQEAKRPETRARRLEAFVAMLVRGETVHPQSRSSPVTPSDGDARPES
jgi:uncharacterized protein YdeI (YjbR/CyaY-like superfamily)